MGKRSRALDLVESLDDEERKAMIQNVVVSLVSSFFIVGSTHRRIAVVGRNPNRITTDYSRVVEKILCLKQTNPSLFTRMYRLSPTSFDRVLAIVGEDLKPKGPGGCNVVPPIIKLCLALRVLAGGSYLDLSFSYDVPHNVVHHYAWQAIHAIDQSRDPFIDNIVSPTQSSQEKLRELERGFAGLSGYRLRGTVAAGDGIVFRMLMPTNEEVDGDVTAYYVRKGYYAYGLQVCKIEIPFVLLYLY